MSYARTGDPDSDVHVYETTEAGSGPAASAMLVCCHGADHFTDHADFRTKRRGEMIAHLREHAAASLRVPARAVDKLRQEQRDKGDIVRTEQEAARASAGKTRRR